jgi:F-type H+-transporting ATPase subunit delta
MKTSKQTKREAKRLFRFCLVNGLLDEGRTRQVVQRIIDGKRRGGLTLLSHFQRLVKLERARRTAEVESAVPLPADLRAGIQAALARTYGQGIRTSFAHNPGLIGGMRIKVGSDVYDGSVRARLAALEKRF